MSMLLCIFFFYFLLSFSVQTYIDELKAITKNKIVFTSVQYLERLKGIPLQMETIKTLLKYHKELVGKIIILVVYIHEIVHME